VKTLDSSTRDPISSLIPLSPHHICSFGQVGLIDLWNSVTFQRSSFSVPCSSKSSSHSSFIKSAILIPSEESDSSTFRVWTGDTSGIISIWNIQPQGSQVFQIEEQYQLSAPIFCMCLVSETHSVWVGGERGFICYLPLQKRDYNNKKEWTGHGTTNVNGIVSIGGKYNEIWSCGDDENINVWNRTNGQFVRILKGHSSKILSMAVSNGIGGNNTYVLSGGFDLKIFVWNVKNHTCLQVLSPVASDTVKCILPFPNSNVFWSGHRDRVLRIWDPFIDSNLLKEKHTTRNKNEPHNVYSYSSFLK